MKSVLIKSDQQPDLEAVLPIDRVVEIDEAGRASLSDQQFVIADSQIEAVVV